MMQQMNNHNFDQLVIDGSDFLHPYAISLTKNGEDAKDLYQETLLRALSNRDKYQPGTNLKGWLSALLCAISLLTSTAVTNVSPK